MGGDAVGRVRVTNERGRPSLGSRGRGARRRRRGRASTSAPSPSAAATRSRSWCRRSGARSSPSVRPAASRATPSASPGREVVSGRRVDLYVHPRTTLLPSLTAGWIRDLEGRTTNDLSTSDVAFHTLREYSPGDDRRHIHWRTTARLGTLMVRQFVDTRRSHLGLVLSTDDSDWADDDSFELGRLRPRLARAHRAGRRPAGHRRQRRPSGPLPHARGAARRAERRRPGGRRDAPARPGPPLPAVHPIGQRARPGRRLDRRPPGRAGRLRATTRPTSWCWRCGAGRVPTSAASGSATSP